MAKDNVLIVNGGGPTAVINLTDIGIIEGVLEYTDERPEIYASFGGTGALIGEHATPDGKRHVARIDELVADRKQRELIKATPSTWIGSGRYKLGSSVKKDAPKDEKQKALDYDISKVMEVVDQLEIGHVFFVGGDDTLTTLNALADYAERHPRTDWPTFLSVPKTVDNDLPYEVDDPNPGAKEVGVYKKDGKIQVMDACPGFGTAAQFVATNVAHLAVEAKALDRHYIIEIMGRDAGFLTAASLLATEFGYGPHLIGVREHGPFDIDAFNQLIAARQKEFGWGVYCVSEGIRDENDKPLAAKDVDSFGHPRLAGAGEVLRDSANDCCSKDGIKADIRYLRFGELQRVCTTFRSSADAEIAYKAGFRAAYWAIVRETTGKLVTIVRDEEGTNPTWKYGLVDTRLVAHKKRDFHDEWLDWADYQGIKVPMVKEGYLDYLRPLVDPVEPIAPPFTGSEVQF